MASVGAQRQPPSFPERVGRYELILPIGSGGMASVYLARALGIGGFERQVAVKLIHNHLRQTEQHAGDLFDEARFAARIHHRNVVQVIDVGDDVAGAYLVMDYVEGDTLASMARAAAERRAAIPQRIALRILCDALAGLHAAHALRNESGEFVNLVHRDFSPQNLLVDVDGATRLTDFGVLKAAGRNIETQTGLTKGKVAYMSPEQVRGEALDRRSDVWAAGVVAWELLANRRLFGGRDDVTTLMRVLSEPPRRLRDVGVEVPEALDEAIASALVADPSERCASARQLREELLAVAPGVADHAEVAALLMDLSGARINERRARAQAILKERARLRHEEHHEHSSELPSTVPPPRANQRPQPVIEAPSAVTEVSVVASKRERGRGRALGVGVIAATAAGVALVGALALRGRSEVGAAPEPRRGLDAEMQAESANLRPAAAPPSARTSPEPVAAVDAPVTTLVAVASVSPPERAAAAPSTSARPMSAPRASTTDKTRTPKAPAGLARNPYGRSP